jgi:hypothetical protein
VLEGCVETERQRELVEQIARRVAPQFDIRNRVEVVNLAGKVKTESIA